MATAQLSMEVEMMAAVARYKDKTVGNGWKVKEILAVGRNKGVVMLVERGGKPKVIKRFHNDESSQRAAYREIEVSRDMKHCPFALVCDYEWRDEFQYAWLIIPYCAKGDLVDLKLAQQGAHIPEATIKSYVCQLALALNYAHSKAILHRDIKLENIFLHEDGYIVLGDWDLAHQAPLAWRSYDDGSDARDRSKWSQQRCGTVSYFSPEMINKDPVTHRVKYAEPHDVWCAGLTFYKLCSYKQPEPWEIQNCVMQGLPFADIPSFYSSELNNVIKRMLQLDPAARLTLPQLLREPCLRTEAIAACRLYNKLDSCPAYEALLQELLQAEAAAGRASIASTQDVPSSGTSSEGELSSLGTCASGNASSGSSGTDGSNMMICTEQRSGMAAVEACTPEPNPVAAGNTTTLATSIQAKRKPVLSPGVLAVLKAVYPPPPSKATPVRPCPAPTARKATAPAIGKQMPGTAAVTGPRRTSPAVVIQATKVVVTRPGSNGAAAQAVNKPAVPASAKARIAERQAAALAKYGAGRQGASNAARAPSVVRCPVKTEAAPAPRQSLQLAVNKIATPAAARPPSSKVNVVPVAKPLNAATTITAAPTKPAAATRAVPVAKPLTAATTITAAPTKPAAATRAVPVAKPLTAATTITAAPTKPAAATRAVPVAKPLTAATTITAAPTKPAAATRAVPVAKPLTAATTITAAPTKPAAATRAVPAAKPLTATPTITAAPTNPAAATKLTAVATTVTDYPVKPTAPKQVHSNLADSAVRKPKPAARMAAQARGAQQRSSKPTWV